MECYPETFFQEMYVQNNGFEQVTSGLTYEGSEQTGLWVNFNSQNWYFVKISKTGLLTFEACILAKGSDFEFDPGKLTP